jgi:hypothetical protein
MSQSIKERLIMRSLSIISCNMLFYGAAGLSNERVYRPTPVDFSTGHVTQGFHLTVKHAGSSTCGYKGRNLFECIYTF